MALSTVTLNWDLTDLMQSSLEGTLSITPTAQMSDTADHVLIPPVARTWKFTGGTGSLAGIVANDNASVLPAGTGYLISVTDENGKVIVPQFQTQLNFANGAVQWLDALATVPVVTTSYQYLPLPSGPPPSSGQVPVATGSGEASAWGTISAGVSSVFGRTGAVTAQSGDYTAAQVGATAAAMTALGDTIYGGASGVAARLAGDTSNARKFLREQSSGGVAQAPAWDTLQAADLGAGTPAAGKTLLATGASTSAWVGFPEVIVSPVGIAGGAAVANNGWPFGPDTPGTVTSGIQEAFNSLPACTAIDAFHNVISGQKGHVRLLPGIFQTSGPITIPPGTIKFTGMGTSEWSEVFSPLSGPTEDLGGSVIVGSDFTHSVVTCPLASFGYPATALWMNGIEIRLISPASQQTTAAPSVLLLAGQVFGEVINVAVLEAASAGGVGHNMYVICDLRCGQPANKNDVYLRNIRGYGGNTGVAIDQAHCHGVNISGGSTGNGLANATGILLNQELENSFENLHCFSTNYGLTYHAYTPATGQPRVPQVLRTVHFESVTHFMRLSSNSQSGTLFIDQPLWDVTSPVPATDIASQLSTQTSTPNAATLAGLAVITSRELNDKNIASGWHVTPGTASLTAGATPYTFPQWPYDVLLVITTVGDMSALTLDGQALFGGTFSAGQMIPVRAGHALVATYTTTAPVFQVIPQ